MKTHRYILSLAVTIVLVLSVISSSVAIAATPAIGAEPPQETTANYTPAPQATYSNISTNSDTSITAAAGCNLKKAPNGGLCYVCRNSRDKITRTNCPGLK